MRLAAAVVLSGALSLACGVARAGDMGQGVGIDVESGAGYDTNPTRAPSDGYFDQRAEVEVNPEKHPTLFLPVLLRADYRPGRDDRSFLTELRVRGDFFVETDASNADELHASVEPGYEWLLGGRGSRRNRLRATPFASYNRELYYDRDSGDDFLFVDGGDPSRRYTYSAVGGEIDYDHRATRKVELSVSTRFEDRNYEDAGSLSSLDQRRYAFDGEVEVELGRRTNLYLDYRYTVHDYDERPSRSLDGRALLANPARHYSYHSAGVSVRRRLVDHWTLYFDYDHRLRADDFEGYHDYVQDAVGLRLLLRGNRWRLRVAPEYWTRDYDAAFAFDLPTSPVDGTPNPHLTYDTFTLDLRVERGLPGPLSIVGELAYRDEDSADPRYAYAREQITAGVRWRVGR